MPSPAFAPLVCPALLLAALLAFLAPAARGDDKPGVPFPVCADPVVIATPGGKGYYVFSTGRGLPILFSPDLVRWRPAGRVFDGPVPAWAKEVIPGATNVWAPDISFFNGKYHLYYAVSTFGSQRSAIGLAVAGTLDTARPGAWQDRGPILQSRPGRCDFNAIDPALFVDRDGTPYLFWGSYWSGLKATRIDPATGRPTEVPPAITPVAARAPGTNPPAIEAPFAISRDGWYYLFVSWDFCCAGFKSTYRILVGRSKNVLGPYVDAEGKRLLDGGGTPVLASSPRWKGTGHNSVLQTPKGDYLLYSCYDAKGSDRQRVLNVRPLRWRDGWPVAGDVLGE